MINIAQSCLDSVMVDLELVWKWISKGNNLHILPVYFKWYVTNS